MKKSNEEIVKEILEKCNKENIRVHYILKTNKKELGMDYFIAPPVEDVGICFGGRHGYSYNPLFKTIKKDSIGSANLIYNHEQFVEIYRDKQFD